MRFTAAAVQFEPRLGAKEQNLAELLRLTEEAARAGARLIVLPEMATTGYCFRNRAEVAPYAEPIPGGPTVERFAALAAKYQAYIVIGMAEVEPATGIFYNTAALVGPDGFVGKYRKLHSYVDETRWAKDGDLGMPVWETPLGRIAMQICMDADYVEPGRLAALAGADVIAFPTNWLGDQTVWRARAVENGYYWIAANRWGEERGSKFCGNSAIIDPQGGLLSLLSTGDGLCLAEVDTDRAREARAAALAPRLPDRYHDMLLHTHLWHQSEAFPAMPPGRKVVVATSPEVDPGLMADQARWADRQARDKGLDGLDLLLFPSLGDRGAEALPLMEGVARDLGCQIAWGGSDRTWLVGPEGLLADYRAVHTAGGGEPGEDFATVDLAWGRVGLAAGHDLRLPETARILSKRGADLIIAPWAEWREADPTLCNARWLENDTAVAVAARQGPGSIFGSRPRAQEGLNGLLIGVVDTGSERIRSKELLRKLQPYWYGPLVGPAR